MAISVFALCWLAWTVSCHENDSRVNDLCDATARGDTARVQTIVKADPSLVSRRDNNSDTPLHLAAFYGRGDVAALLLADGADVNARGRGGGTPLYYAVWNNRPAVAGLLLSQKPM